MPPRILLLAAPGAGKGTQGARIREHLGVAHLAAGDLLREQVDQGTELGSRASQFVERGELVPDEMVVELLMPAIEAAAAAGGYVLDGFPRNVAQARAAEERGVTLDRVVHLTAPDEHLRERLRARAAKEGRSDDTPEIIDHRLRLYAEATRPLVDHYSGRGILVDVDADRPAEAVTVDVLAAVR